MAEKKLTMADDWGAPGAQATGAQVQLFLKEQISELRTMATSGAEALENIAAEIESLSDSNTGDHALLKEQIEALQRQVRLMQGEAKIAYLDTVSAQLGVCSADDWTHIDSSALVPIGILVPVDGHDPLLMWYVTPNDIAWTVGKNPKFHGNPANIISESDYPKLFLDFSGAKRTAEIAVSDTAGDTCVSTIAGDFSVPDLSGQDLGSWFVPSTGEMYAIGKCIESVNRCLIALERWGAVPFPLDELLLFHTSSEVESSRVWTMTYDPDGSASGQAGLSFAQCAKEASLPTLYVVGVTYLTPLSKWKPKT